MKNKVLKSSTIVPPQLYVERDADRQVEKVLSEMGRPGYVLVARQMGKTNLLLNAKRKFESTNDIFVYVDLSNIYRSPKECFRNFVDTALEANLDLFKPIIKSIYDGRQQGDLEPHQEHNRELRYLLRTIPGKLVFILDEVDALTKTEYSDEVFAQIRSTYFSRVNFKEAERLTYLLSGVAEPAELIKDKSISPFNIGQKIYLDDFSLEEYKNFIHKTGLELPTSVVERIFYWASGNPRITWDICSEIEDILLSSREVNPTCVDEVVRLLYLNAFDRPPVDHIRNIVEKDKELRNAIVEIRYSKGEMLSDSIKSKLYLSGIIGGYSHNKQIQVKNKIIDDALSQKFLDSIEIKRKGTYAVAIDKYLEGNYGDALIHFKIYLNGTPSLDSVAKSELYFKMGKCAYNLQEIANAKQFFDKSAHYCLNKPTDVYFESHYILGVCNFYLGDVENAISEFDLVCKANRKDITYLKALLSLVSLHGIRKDYDIGKELYYQLVYDVNELAQLGDIEQEYQEILATAKYNLGHFSLQQEDKESAISYFSEAIEISPDSYKPAVYLSMAQCSSSVEIVISNIQKFLSVLPLINISSDKSPRIRTLELDVNTFYGFLVLAQEHNLEDWFLVLLQTLKESAFGREADDASIWMALAKFAIVEKKPEQALKAYLTVINNSLNSGSDHKICYSAAKTIFAIAARNEQYRDALDNAASGYSASILNISESDVTHDFYDLYASCWIIFTQLNEDLNSEIINKLLQISSKSIDGLGKDYEINNIWVSFVAMKGAEIAEDKSSELSHAKHLLKFDAAASNKQKKTCLIDLSSIKSMISAAQTTVAKYAQAEPNMPVIIPPKYGRNEYVSVRYTDGREVTTKFKKIVDDIRCGICEIIV